VSKQRPTGGLTACATNAKQDRSPAGNTCLNGIVRMFLTRGIIKLFPASDRARQRRWRTKLQ